MITDENFDKEGVVDAVLDFADTMPYLSPDALVTWTVDATLRYVIDWLQATGYSAKADILKQLGEIR